jgi:hypothetical protein
MVEPAFEQKKILLQDGQQPSGLRGDGHVRPSDSF